MPKRLTIVQAQQQLLTREQLASVLETIDILSDLEFSQKLHESIAQAERGETILWEDAKKQLGIFKRD